MKRGIACLMMVLVLSACDQFCRKEKSAQSSATSAPAIAAEGAVVAQLNGTPITSEEVRAAAGARLTQAEVALYDVRKQVIDEIIEDRIVTEEAKKRGIEKAELLKNEILDKVAVSDEDVQKFYDENKARLQGKKLEEVKTNIQGYLYREKHQKLYGEFLEGLKKKATIAMLIEAPKVEIEEGDNPGIGPKTAAVKIVEFTDYQCPFCGKVRPTVNQILEEYRGKVRYVLRDFPLSFHKDAMKAHEAARCAGEQNKYWEMNKKLFANQRAITVEDLKAYSKELKLDQKKFDECLDSGKYQETVQSNQAYGEEVGVSGTPAFFINGRMISGARPYSAFKEIIDEELSRHN